MSMKKLKIPTMEVFALHGGLFLWGLRDEEEIRGHNTHILPGFVRDGTVNLVRPISMFYFFDIF